MPIFERIFVRRTSGDYPKFNTGTFPERKQNLSYRANPRSSNHHYDDNSQLGFGKKMAGKADNVSMDFGFLGYFLLRIPSRSH